MGFRAWLANAKNWRKKNGAGDESRETSAAAGAGLAAPATDAASRTQASGISTLVQTAERQVYSAATREETVVADVAVVSDIVVMGQRGRNAPRTPDEISYVRKQDPAGVNAEDADTDVNRSGTQDVATRDVAAASGTRHVAGVETDPIGESGKRGVGSRLGSYAIATGKAIKPVLDIAADSYPPIKVAAVCLNFVLERIETTDDNKKRVRILHERITEILGIMEQGPIDDALKTRCDKLARKLESVTKKLGPIGGLADDSSKSFRRKCSRYLNAPKNSALVQDYILTVDHAVQDYQLALLQDIYFEQTNRNEHQTLNTIARASGAGFRDSVGRSSCLPGTRMELLDALYAWTDDSASQPVFWLNGPAGSGKSTIAQSFAETLFLERKLGGSYYCSRNTSDRSDLRNIFPIIAIQLARADNPATPAYRSALVRAIELEPDIATGSLQNQLDKLIIGPARVSGMSTIVVIDALDECKDEEATSTFLTFLGRNINEIPNIRFFITSRPEPFIHRGFIQTELQPITTTQALHTVEAAWVNRDIRLVLKTELSRIATQRTDLKLKVNWVTDRELNELVEKAERLFIYATTVIKFINTEGHDPRDRLQQVLTPSDNTQPSGAESEHDSPFQKLDTLYSQVLNTAFPGNDTRTLRSILGLLVVACEGVSPATIADILCLKRVTDVGTSLSPLQSVLLLPAGGDNKELESIQFHHKSFLDFLTDPTRCTDKRFWIDRDEYHATVARRCFELMQRKLKKNICELQRYSTNNNLDPAVRDKRIDEALRYCCRYWASHLLSDSRREMHLLEDMHSVLDRWLKTKLLQWFEALALLHELGRAVEALANVKDWFMTCDLQYQATLALIIDSHKFILSNFDTVHMSAVHIYHSSLPFAPEQSLLKQCYANSDDMKDEARVLQGCKNAWSKVIRTISVPDQAWEVKYSHDGSMLAASGKGFSQLFNSKTGERLAELESGYMWVRSVSFSLDDRTLATASDSQIHLWEINTGSRISTLHSDGAYIHSLDFHPHLDHILVAGDERGRVHTWDVRNSARTTFHVAGSSGILCWLQRRDQKLVLVGCNDGRIEMWDVDTAEQVRIFSVHSYDATTSAVASSSDGSLVASGLKDNSRTGLLIVYNAHTGDVVHSTPENNRLPPISSMAFSPTAPSLVFGADSGAIGSFSYGDHVTSFLVHSSSDVTQDETKVHSVAFSPNGGFIAVASDDRTIRIWETDTAKLAQDNEYGSRSIEDAHFSNDGQFIVSFSIGRTEVWDASTGALCATLKERRTEGGGGGIILSGVTYVISADVFQNLVLWEWRQNSTAAVVSDDANGGLWVITVRLFPYPHDTTVLGFITTQTKANDPVRGAHRLCCCWTIDVSHTGDPRIVLTARGVLARDEWVVRITHRGSVATEDLTLVLECNSGKQFSALWRNSTVLADPPQELLFVEEAEESPLKGTDWPPLLTASEVYCRWSEDGAWVLDEHDRQILWVPRSNRGHGRWHGRRLLIPRNRFTLVDFSNVNPSESSSF